ncbi:hypothetical protein NKH93_24845 [Mesorhizobium sp. M0954]
MGFDRVSFIEAGDPAGAFVRIRRAFCSRFDPDELDWIKKRLQLGLGLLGMQQPARSICGNRNCQKNASLFHRHSEHVLWRGVDDRGDCGKHAHFVWFKIVLRRVQRQRYKLFWAQVRRDALVPGHPRFLLVKFQRLRIPFLIMGQFVTNAA